MAISLSHGILPTQGRAIEPRAAVLLPDGTLAALIPGAVGKSHRADRND
jgi:hypothetical protein